MKAVENADYVFYEHTAVESSISLVLTVAPHRQCNYFSYLSDITFRISQMEINWKIHPFSMIFCWFTWIFKSGITFSLDDVGVCSARVRKQREGGTKYKYLAQSLFAYRLKLCLIF